MLAALGGLVAPAERALASGRTFKPFIEQAVARVGAAPLAFHRSTFDWGVVFYADRRIPRVDDGEATEPTWVLAWEASDLARASEREVALRSSGTGPKGRSRLVLLPPERSRPGTP
jgi:hypothetical protein